MDALLEKLLRDTEAMRAPFAGDAPGGVDLTLDLELERLKAEVDKLSSPTGGAVDWRGVMNGAAQILANRSKDLRAAAWMTCAAVERAEWEAFARGLVVLRALAGELWTASFPPPKRERARANLITWLCERASLPLEGLAVSDADADAVRLSAALVDEIDVLLEAHLGELYPGLGTLKRALQSRVRAIPERPAEGALPSPAEAGVDDDDGEPAPSSETAPSSEPAPSNEVLRASLELSTDPADARASVGRCAEALLAIARGLASGDTSSPWQYRLRRQALAVAEDARAVAEDAGPSPEETSRLAALFGARRWVELALASEEALARHPRWLETHFFTATALERLGLAHAEAREAVGREASALVRRRPELLAALFPSGLALASEEARAWFHAEVERWQPPHARVGEALRAAQAKRARRFETARDLLRLGQGAQALELAMRAANQTSEARERFRGGLIVAEMAIAFGEDAIAVPVLERLHADAATHALDAWEPGLVVELYRLYWRALRGVAEARPEIASLRSQLFSKICALDPGAALALRVMPKAGEPRGAQAQARVAPAEEEPAPEDYDDD